MSVPRRVAGAVTANSRIVILLMLVVTGLVAAGLPMIDTDVDLEEITGDSPETQANDYVEENFTSAGGENTTAVLLVHTGNNTLTRESVLRSLRLQQRLRDNDSINRTLIDDDPITGLENIVAIGAIGKRLEDQGDELDERADELNATTERLEAGLDEVRALQREFETDTVGLGENSSEYRELEAQLEADTAAVIERVAESLGDDQRYSYNQSANVVRRFEAQLVEMEREFGEDAPEQAVYNQTELEIESEYTWATLGIREAEFGELSREADRLEEAADELEDERPPLAEQIAALQNDNLSRSEYHEVVRDVLNGTGPRSREVLSLVAASYRVDSTTADARMTVLTQRTAGEGGFEGITNQTTIDAQLALRGFVSGGGNAAPVGDQPGPQDTAETDGRTLVFGGGLVEHETDLAVVDTLAIVIPLTLVLVVLALSVAYRDPLDILLGLVGIVTVLLWTFGAMGWVGIPFNVLLVAVPVLLIGISIDFAVHVLMRHREHRTPADPEESPGPIRPAMTTAIAGVGIALFWAAATTVIGFFANVVSPLGLIRQFGLASGLGIASALLVFTTLVPALKIELDEFLESHGFGRHRRAFGTTGRLSRALAAGETVARRAPLLLIVLLVVVTAVSGVAATNVDTTFEQQDFIAHSPPEWTHSLPGPMAPGEYHTASSLDVVNERFRPADAEAQLLVTGEVNATAAFERVVEARRTAAGTPRVYTLPNGQVDIQDPLSVMRTVAEDDDEFNESFRAADVDNDSVPERNISGLYDALFSADSDAAGQVIHRTPGGEYAAVRLIVGIEGGASFAQTTAAMRDIATAIERDSTTGVATSGEGGESANLTAVATGQSVVNRVIERSLFETLTRSFVVTLVAVFLVLAVGYRLAGHGAALGAVTLVPVTLSVAWILGTMSVLGVPFNVLTVTITSLTIGLGVSYSIHVSARYRLELDRQENAWTALETTLTGTGGALLGSVATTTAAFGTLGLAILPVLAQFGLITAITIVYAFLASVLVLPTLLVLWTKYVRVDVSLRPPGSDEHRPSSDAGPDGAESD